MPSSSEGTPPISGPGRVALILKAFEQDPRPKRLIDLSELTGLAPATVSRFATELVSAGLLARNKDKSFQPGPALLRIARQYDAANMAS